MIDVLVVSTAYRTRTHLGVREFLTIRVKIQTLYKGKGAKWVETAKFDVPSEDSREKHDRTRQHLNHLFATFNVGRIRLHTHAKYITESGKNTVGRLVYLIEHFETRCKKVDNESVTSNNRQTQNSEVALVS